MLSSIDKGVKAAEISRPPAGVYGDVDLRVLPKYISYKASNLREKTNLHFVMGLMLLAWISTFVIQNNRVEYWQTKFREKEFILVPSKIVGHTPATPQSVPDSYVKFAVKSFIQMSGTTTPSGIRDQLERFAGYMEKKLGSRYLADMEEWIELSEKKGLYEQVEHTNLKFAYHKKSGVIDVDVVLRRDRRENADFLGTAMEKMKMTLLVQQPKPDQEWTFKIVKYSRKPM